MADTVQTAGEFSVDKCELITSKGIVIDLSSMLLEINLFEDIYSSAVKGSIICVDSNEVIGKAQIIGQDYVRLKISTPGFNEEGEIIDYSENVFQVYKIGNRVDVSENAEVFELSIISTESVKNQRTRVSKSMVGTASEIFEQLMISEFGINTKKKLHIEDTSGIKKYVIPNEHPFTFFRHLLNDSISQTDMSPLYLFFENTKGYHFRTLQSLYAEPTKSEFNLGSPGEYQDAGSKVKDIEKEYRTVISDDNTGNNDMFKNIISGLLASKLQELDIFGKTITNKEYNYFEEFKKFNRINDEDKNIDNPIYVETPIDDEGRTIADFPNSKIHLNTTLKDAETGGDAQHYNSTTESYSYAPNDKNKSIQHRIAKMIELSTTLQRNMKVNGNTALACGQTFMFTKPDAKNKEGGYIDEHESGKYLITALRHMFNVVTNKHEVIMSACKDSHPKAKENEATLVEPKGTNKGIVHLSR